MVTSNQNNFWQQKRWENMRLESSPATTAFGKTVIALWLISQRRINTLILVHRKQLMDQWVERIVQFLGIPKKDIGRFGGGRKKRNGLIDVAVMQSVSKKGEVEEWISEYGQIIPVLVRMYNKRLKGYSSLGYTVN